MVTESRKKEYGNLVKLGVFKEVDETWARKRGKKIFRSRWIDYVKVDEYFGVIGKSMVVIQDVATSARSDVFTATPPLFSCRLVVSLATSRKQRHPPRSRRLARYDATNAFPHADKEEEVYVTPLWDLRRKGKVWRLLKMMYGRRRASLV